MRRLVAGAATFLLAGCIPFPYGTYYRPAYPDPSATVSQASCGGQAGPPARIAFQAPPGLKVEANALRAPLERSGDRPLAVALELPPGHVLRFSGDTLRVASDERDARDVVPAMRAVTIYRLRPEAWIDAAALAPADPAARRTADEPVAKATLGFGKLDVKGDAIEVVLPALDTDRGPVTLPPLALTADIMRRGVRTFRTAEYLQSVLDREAACRRETPQQRCDNIRQFDAYSFRIQADAFAVVGRFWMMETSKGIEPLQFEVEVLARDARRWRFAAPEVRVRDTAGQWHVQRFAEVRAVFAAPVSLSTPIRSATTGAATTTSVRIAANLGSEERWRYVVTFPPYDFDGVRHEMKPLELERRMFDIGLEPFNC